MKFPLSNWFRALKIILFSGVNYLFALIVLSVIGQYAPEGVLLPAYNVLLWLLAGLIFNTAYYRFESLRKLLFISVLVLITVLKIGSGYYELAIAFFCFILGVWQGSWVLSHYELMVRLKQYTFLILLGLFFYKGRGKTGELLLLLTGYILISLLALSTYNLETISFHVSQKKWVFVTVIVSLMAVIIALLFALFVDPAYVSSFFSLLKDTYFALVDVVVKILTPLFAPLVNALSFILSAILRYSHIRRFQAGSGETGAQSASYEYKEYIMPEVLEIILKIASFILVILVFATFILTVLKKYTSSKKKDFMEDEKETVFKLSSFKNSLLRLITKTGKVLNSYKRTAAYWDSPAGKIRRIYAQILKEAAKKGYCRNSSETPLEYMPRLKKAFEDAGGFVERITLLYQRARYFPDSVSPSDVEDIKKFLKALFSK
ncbi:protein of unknown function [Caldanaerovirga acetigignens]|uniref:Protein-glutamine gamma-glutamyltransferase-like C-terminal domain-containing protein n=1 Tax=Caldanaerovirga acetigignens TaxID=447595 RepID=A0A1M7HHY4_9FIRM|nr:DUF4129 domain-containing protein [Caldanaerovirga acetigignens]SHM28080.1 protein of unknown function [Caldanaerovirga acetigignens]